jgi:hypothetical protein
MARMVRTAAQPTMARPGPISAQRVPAMMAIAATAKAPAGTGREVHALHAADHEALRDQVPDAHPVREPREADRKRPGSLQPWVTIATRAARCRATMISARRPNSSIGRH